MRFVNSTRQFVLRIIRLESLRKASGYTFKVAAATVIAILTILASLASILSAALATQKADGPKILLEIPKQLVSFPEEFGEILEQAQLALDKYLEVTPTPEN